MRHGFSFLVLLTSLVSTAVSAADLHLKANETRVLEGNSSSYVFDSLILEDGATLILPPQPFLHISAAQVSIGTGVTIQGVAKSGGRGANGEALSEAAASCGKPVAGGSGEDGLPGQDATDLTLDWHLLKLGSLNIELEGGAGGDGGHGGAGQAADDNGNCERIRGGAGGRGGQAGDGGDGGDVQLNLSAKNPALLQAVRDLIRVNNDGGAAGSPGSGAKGAEGTPGHYINRKSLSGNKTWVAGGKQGDSGADGEPGREGASGRTAFSVAATKTPAVSTASTESTLEARVQSLESQLKEALHRIEALEQAQ